MRNLAGYMPVSVQAAVAAAASFGHISTLAARDGQGGLMGWAIAVCTDLACVTAAAEIRKDRKEGRSSVVPWIVLVSFASLSLAANVATAQPTTWGRLLAAVPCASFITATGLLERRAMLSRAAREPQEEEQDQEEPEHAAAIQAARRYLAEKGRPITRDALRAELGVSTTRASEILRAIRPAITIGET